jgi:GDP-L-fucose synthase
MRTYEGEQLVNIGCGADVTIRELAEVVARIVGFSGRLVYDTTKPDGTPRKLLDVGRLAGLGWKARISLEEGVADTYRWFVANKASVRSA